MVITRQPNMKRKIRLSESDLYNIVRRVIESKKNHVCCNRCDWEWDITPDDNDPYLCHMCGNRNDPQESNEVFSEQENNEPNYVQITFPEEPFNELENDGSSNNLPDGPIKILNNKFAGKSFTVKDDDFEVDYNIQQITAGRKTQLGFFPKHELEPGERSISGWGKIEKVLYRGHDITPIIKKITNSGGKVKEMAKLDAIERVSKISKHFGLYPEKFKIGIW